MSGKTGYNNALQSTIKNKFFKSMVGELDRRFNTYDKYVPHADRHLVHTGKQNPSSKRRLKTPE